MNELSVKFSIRWKLLTIMICLVVSVLAISTYLQIASQKQIFERELDLRITLIKEKLISRGGMLSSNLSRQIENGLATVNLSLISEVLKKIVDEDKELTYAILVDSSGRSYVHTLKPDLELEILSGHKTSESPGLFIYEHAYDDVPVMEFIVPIQISTEPWGVLRLGFSLDVLNQEVIGFQKDNAFKVQTMIKQSVFVACAFIAITVFIILILSDRLSRPLRRLTKVVNKFAAGDFLAADNIKVNSRDEIGVLAKAFVDMSLDLRASYLKLHNYNVTLEQKVKERTAELAEARDEAIKANQSKSHFLSMISHEIRTPMNAIIGMTQMSLKTDLNDIQHDYLSKVQSSADSLLLIINDLLDTSKIEAGQLAVEAIPFNLEDVLIHLNTLVGIKAEEKSIELHFSIAPDVPLFLIGDPLRIGQILLNLVGNAIKFTDTGDIIVKIELVEESNFADSELMLKFTVKDSGIGLQPQQIEGLFKPFVQADLSTSRLYGGTGLGLTISKQLVELMGGEITVESEFGLGSDFIFTLCLMQSNDSAAKKPTISAISCQGTNVLVVDDNALAREILKTYLESFEFNVGLACSGLEAIAVLENAHENPYSLVLMDWKMSGMDGIQTAKMIKESKKIDTVPTIIMVTAYAKEDVLPKVKSLELAGVIIKPVNPSYLFDSVISTLQTECVIDGIDKKSMTKPAEDTLMTTLKGKRILVVDDNSINQQVAQTLLEYEGLEVSLADNGQQAVQMVKDIQFDAVLMDLQMPVMDGFEATQLIRSENHYSDLPIIALTAYAREKEREKCLSHGMQDCVSKPIDIDQLLLIFSQYFQQEAIEHNHGLVDLIYSKNSAEAGVKSIQLSGLDITAGIKNVAGDEPVYFKLLQDFEQQFTDVLQRIKSSLATGNKQQAKQLAHGLKGVASNIAAFDLADKALGLDIALKEQQKESTLPVKGCEDALHQVLSDIKKLLVYRQEHIDFISHNNAPDYELANKELIKLTELLRVNSLDIDWCFDVIKASLVNSEFTEEVKQLGQSISEFDFKTALSNTQVLVQKLPVDQVDHVIEKTEIDNKPRILIVDDIPVNIKVLAQVLRDEYVIQVANNGYDVDSILKISPQADLILLDIEMPGLNGYELCQKLKADEQTKNIPVIFITGRSEAIDEKNGLEMGAVDYIVKPFNNAVVKARIKTHIELKRQGDLLEQLASNDGLTGIANRRKFDEVMDQEWVRAIRSQKPLSVIFVDVDHFKSVNDVYGHAVGDQCLIVVADTIKSNLKRKTDIVARYGGEEFVLILPEVDAKSALMLAETMRIKIEQLKIACAQTNGFISLTISLGFATVVPTMEFSASDLVAAADEAVYKAKSCGRNQVKEGIIS